MSQQNKTKTEG